MLPKGCVQADGSLLVTSSDPSGTATEDIIYVNGLPVNNLGQLQMSFEPIVSYAMGLPFDAEGRLVVQDVATEGEEDRYNGGFRVGTSGIHMDDSADADESEIFNNGIRCTAPGAVYVSLLVPNSDELSLLVRNPIDSDGTYLIDSSPGVGTRIAEKAISTKFDGATSITYDLTGYEHLNAECHEISIDFYNTVEITKDTAGAVLVNVGSREDYTGINIGSVTGLLADEVICVVNGGTASRSGSVGTIPVGRHTISAIWSDSDYGIYFDGVKVDSLYVGTPAIITLTRLIVGMGSGGVGPLNNTYLSNLIIKDADGQVIFQDPLAAGAGNYTVPKVGVPGLIAGYTGTPWSENLGFGYDWNEEGHSDGSVETLTDNVELFADPTVNSPWIDNGDGSYTIDGSQVAYIGLSVAGAGIIGESYKLSFDVDNTTAGTVQSQIGSGVGDIASASGHYEEIVTCADYRSTQINANASFSGTVSNISVQKVIPGKIPQDPDNPSLDVYGNALNMPGKARNNLNLYSYTVDWDGATYLADASLVGTETVASSTGTSTVSVSAGRLDFTSGWCDRVVLSNGNDYIIEQAEDSTSPIVFEIVNGSNGTLYGYTGSPWTTQKAGSLLHALGYKIIGGIYVPTGGGFIEDPVLHTNVFDSTENLGTAMSSAFTGATLAEMTDDEGVYVGPGYTNLFSLGATAEETKTLTAQSYCVQCTGTGAEIVCGAYGTATTDTPLQFTASAGDTTFTPNANCESKILTAGLYFFPYIPPGTSRPSGAGSTTNGLSWLMDESVFGALQGVPDGVELVTNGNLEGTYVDGVAPDWTYIRGTATEVAGIEGSAQNITNIAGNTGVVGQIIDIVVGERYQLTFWARATKGSGGKFFDYVGGSPQVLPIENITDTSWKEYKTEVFTALYDQIKIGLYANTNAVADTNGCSFDNISIQKLLPATCTVLAEAAMGVGSGELPISTNVDCVGAKDSTSNLIYAQIGSDASKRIVRSYDGTTGLQIIQTWDRNEVHKRAVQANASGFRVGYRRFESDGVTPISDWVWSAYSAFDGSFDPLDYLRVAYGSTVPMHFRSLSLWDDGSITEAQLNAPVQEVTYTGLPGRLSPFGSYSFTGPDSQKLFWADTEEQTNPDDDSTNDPINFLYEPDEDKIFVKAIELLPSYGDELVINGNFDTDSAWTKDSGWSINNGTAIATEANYTRIAQGSAIIGKTYLMQFTIVSITEGSLKIRIGGVNGVARSTVGTFSELIVAETTSGPGVISSSSSTTAVVDNISAKEITGYGAANINNQDFFGERGLVLYNEPQTTVIANRVTRYIKPYGE